MPKKDKRFELRLTGQELRSLDELVEKHKADSRSHWVCKRIEAAAKREGVWVEKPK